MVVILMVNAVFCMNVVACELYFAARDLQNAWGTVRFKSEDWGPGPYFPILSIFAVYRSLSKGCNDGQ